jgi:outer membrane immunogenic protein
MRHCGAAIAAAAILAPSLAHAADLEVFKAEQPTIYVPNYFVWGGVYVGGFLGGGWGTADWGSGSITVNLPLGTTLTVPSLPLAHVNVPTSGFLGGGRVGVNYQAGAWVFGFEGDFTGMTLKGHGTSVFSGTASATALQRTITVSATGTSAYQTTDDWAATLTGRLGYTFDRMLAYGKVGMVVEQDGDTEVSNTTSCTVTVTDTSTKPPTITTHPCTGLTRAGTATRYGGTAGAGLEYAFDKHWSAFAEYNHFGFLSHLINLGTGTIITTRLVGLNIDRIIAGANYRF